MSLREMAPASLADTLSHSFEGMRTRLAVMRVRRAAYLTVCRELGSYTDRELADLGISRADIHDIAREHADRTAAALA